MNVPVTTPDSAAAIKAEAERLGFALVGIAPAVGTDGFEHFSRWLDQGFAGEMEYLERRRDAYREPQSVLEGVRSVIMVGMNYRGADPPEVSGSEGRVSRYAWGDVDYHDLLKDKLRTLADCLHQLAPGCRTRCVVDTAPLLERDFARLAGLGWFGKNTMLINKHQGSWLFLGAVLTEVELPFDAPHESAHCGTCTRCLESCPTDAFVEPYVLDATKCISYLTIELRDAPVPVDLREGVADWLFGCDICQEVCPWNTKAPRSAEPGFRPREDLSPVDCEALLALSEDEFRQRFRHTPLWRPGRKGLLRNACLVLGNARRQSSVPALIAALNDGEPLIRGAAAWALGRIGNDEARAALRSQLQTETDETVRDEINSAIAGPG